MGWYYRLLPCLRWNPQLSPLTEAASPSNPTAPVADLTHRISSSVDSFVPLDDGYLLIGSMQWSADDYPSYGVSPMPYVDYVRVVDANGQEVVWEEVYENVKPQDEEYRSYWAIKILSRTFAAPLTITLNAADVQVKPVPFNFEVGADSKLGQSWEVNQDIQVVDSTVKMLKANLITAADNNLAFQFDAQVDPNAIGDLQLATSLNQCMGGGGGYPIDHLDCCRFLFQCAAPIFRPAMWKSRLSERCFGDNGRSPGNHNKYRRRIELSACFFSLSITTRSRVLRSYPSPAQ